MNVAGCYLVSVSPGQSLESLGQKIKSSSFDVYVSVHNGDFELDQLISLLDSGTIGLVVNEVQFSELKNAGVGACRLILHVGSSVETLEHALSVVDSAGYLIENEGGNCNLDAVSSFAKKASDILIDGGDHKRVFLGWSDTRSFKPIPHAIPIVDFQHISPATADISNGVLSLADILIGNLVSDRSDGLYTTLVVDSSNQCLGFVYSSTESITEAIATGTGVYQSRKRGLWYKGASSGAVQKLLRIDVDCDNDCLKFVVKQEGPGFCHYNTDTCFGNFSGVSSLQKVLQSRKENAPPGSYTARLFNDAKLLSAKIMEEAEELVEAETKSEVSWEAADLIYFAMTKMVASGVSWSDVERNLDLKSRKISRRKGDAKPKWIKNETSEAAIASGNGKVNSQADGSTATSASSSSTGTSEDMIQMQKLKMSEASQDELAKILTRPIQKTSDIMKLVTPIVSGVKERGDEALLEYTAKFDKVELESPVLKAPFPQHLMELSQEVKEAIDLSIANVEKFHSAQISSEDSQGLSVETAPGVVCSRFARPIKSVGLYIPGGTAVLPSTALMLGVPAKVAGCSQIIFASPPRKDGTLTPEVVYVAHKVGAEMIVLAGGAQAVASMAYGTATVPKVDKIMGPGNQFVTAAKMFVQNDSTALCSIDMPAGPSEVLVIADSKSNPDFVASDLLSQAEHGVDSQVILLAVDMSASEIEDVEAAVHKQALALPRVDIVRKSIAHSFLVQLDDIEQAIELSNKYAPEHLILQVENASDLIPKINHAGSVFVGPWSPESCGDYSSGTNHTLPTYGYAKMYSGVNTHTFMKHITSQELTVEGLKNIGPAVMALAATEGLDGHRNAVKVRLDSMMK